jgi:Homeodomain-like domain
VITFQTARDRITSAHRRFHVRAINTMYPTLQPPERTKALVREQRLGQTYLARMQRRLSEGLRRIGADQTLTSGERDARARTLMATEQRYLQLHLTETARRVAREAELHRLIEAGERSGFWLMDPSVHRHTPDCVAMGNRLWPMAVLREINPATRHAGCACRIISEADARRMGHAIVRGYMTATVRGALREGYVEPPTWWRMNGAVERARLGCVIWVPYNEALIEGRRVHQDGPRDPKIDVPIRPGMPGWVGNPYHDKRGRFTSVHGALSPHLDEHMDNYLDAVAKGDPDAIERHFGTLLTQARSKLSAGRARDESIRTIYHVHAVALNPSGERRKYRDPVDVGGQKMHVPLSPREPTIPTREVKWQAGLRDAWGVGHTFRWLVPPGSVSDKHLDAIQRMGPFKLTDTRDGALLETKPARSRDAQKLAHWQAVSLETALPQLRRLRVRKRGEALRDDRPLELRVDMGTPTDDDARYAGIDKNQLGDAAQATLPEFAERLHTLGYISSPTDFNERTIGQANRQGAIDWRVGDRAVEVKGEAWIGRAPGVSGQTGVKDSPKDVPDKYMASKLAEAWQYGQEHPDVGPLRPTGVVPVIDMDEGVAHLFMYDYPGHWDTDGSEASKHQKAVIKRGEVDPVTGRRVDRNTTIDTNWVPEGVDAYSGQRIPVQMWKELASGALEPDTLIRSRQATTGGWRYLGTMGLRYNPHVMPSDALRARDVRLNPDMTGPRLSVGQGQRLVTPERDVTTGRPLPSLRPRPADVVPERRAPIELGGPTPRQRKAADTAIVNRAQAVRLARQHPDWTHREIGDAMGVNFRTVQKYLAQHRDLHPGDPDEDLTGPGPGARRDIKRRVAEDPTAGRDVSPAGRGSAGTGGRRTRRRGAQAQ